MARIVWRDRMSVGVKEIDEDHRRLIDCVNALEDAVKALRFDPKAVERILRDLARYVDEHFAREERVMEALKYPGIQEHREIHRAGRAEMARLARAFLTLPVKTSAEDLYQFLAKWLISHVIMSDKEIGQHLPSRRQGS